MGVGRDARDRTQVIGHVLGKFDPASRTVMDEVVKAAVQAAAAIISTTPQAAMNTWNGWSAVPPTPHD